MIGPDLRVAHVATSGSDPENEEEELPSRIQTNECQGACRDHALA